MGIPTYSWVLDRLKDQGHKQPGDQSEIDFIFGLISAGSQYENLSLKWINL